MVLLVINNASGELAMFKELHARLSRSPEETSGPVSEGTTVFSLCTEFSGLDRRDHVFNGPVGRGLNC